MTDGTDSLCGDIRVERNAEPWQVQVAVDAAELLAGLDHPGGAPAQRHGAVLPVLHVARVRAMEIIDSMLLVERNVRARVGATPRRSTVSVSARPSRRLPAAPGWVRSNSLASASSCASAASAESAR